MTHFHRLGMIPAFARCAKVRSQNPHPVAIDRQCWDECRAWLLFAAVNEGPQDLSVLAALRYSGHSESFVWSDERTGQLWDRWECSSEANAMIDCKREALHLQRHGHCAFVIPKVIRIRAAQVAQRQTELPPPPVWGTTLYHHWLEGRNRARALEVQEANRAEIAADARRSQ